MPSKTNLIKIRDEWYQRLKNEGFLDIEKPSVDYASELKRFNSTNNFKEAQIEYYEKAKEFLNNYNFPEESHRLLWELHSQGMTERKILKWVIEKNIPLNVNKNTMGHSKGQIYRILKTYKKIMKEAIL